MRWQYKASIMKYCSVLPAGPGIYRFIQKAFGRLKADPMVRIPTQIEIDRWILEMGQRGRQAVLKNYNWTTELEKLEKLYQSMMNKRTIKN